MNIGRFREMIRCGCAHSELHEGCYPHKGGSKSTSSSSTANIDKRLVVDSGVGISADSSSVNVQLLDGGAIDQAGKVATGALSAVGQVSGRALDTAEKVTGQAIERAADLTITALEQQRQAQAEALTFAQGAGEAALKFAFDAGRPEASLSQQQILAMALVAGAAIVAVVVKK